MTGRPQCLTRRPGFRRPLTGRPDRMPERPAEAEWLLTCYLISDNDARLTGAMFFYVVVRESWLAEQLPHEMILPKILPVADGLIASGSYLRGSSPGLT
jgi:hypothetical protein